MFRFYDHLQGATLLIAKVNIRKLISECFKYVTLSRNSVAP